MKLTIKGQLPSWNEAEQAARSHWTKGREFKKTWTDFVAAEVVGQGLPIEGLAIAAVTFYEPNHKRDQDNVISGLKYICDGLVKAGLIKDDSPRYLRFGGIYVDYDKENPRIEVELT